MLLSVDVTYISTRVHTSMVDVDIAIAIDRDMRWQLIMIYPRQLVLRECARGREQPHDRGSPSVRMSMPICASTTVVSDRPRTRNHVRFQRLVLQHSTDP
jgi:hypothetical protein